MSFRPQTIKHSLAVAMLVFLAGCQNVENWSNVPETKHPKVVQAQYSYDVSFTPASAQLSAQQGKALLAFLSNAKVTRKDKFYLFSTNKNVPATLSDARKTIVSEYLSTFGIETLSSSGADKPAPKDSVSLVIQRLVVTLPGCPDWSGELTTYNNLPTSNWGCANASNLGRMVVEPEDLILGREPGIADGERAATSISNYRKGETKAITPEDVGITQSQQKTGGEQ